MAYSGVHQAFQIALAAEEAGLLEMFYGSIFDAPGQWGRWLGVLLGQPTMLNRRITGVPRSRLQEFPVPFLLHRFASAFPLSRGSYPWYQANFAFDRAVARCVSASECRLVVGTETCARDSFRAAGERGMLKVLDCPQVHPDFLTSLLAQAAEALGEPPPVPFDPPELAARKAEEFAMADVLLVLSEVHRRSFLANGFAAERLVPIPLWVDTQLWQPPVAPPVRDARAPLQVLFVGGIGLRKGIPWLIRAVEQCGPGVQLTLVGVNSGETDRFLARSPAAIRLAGKKNKAELRALYGAADVLVLPSLVDTFGFVALEAMACGLPVIVTDNCGVPVPDPAWRVPVMNSDAIAQRLEYYARNRDALVSDGKIAGQFAQQFTPERYREQIKHLLKQLLG